jgi:hypothetical protein
MLLDDRKQMGNLFRLRNHHRFAKQRAALGTADIKGIAQPCQTLKRHIIVRA